MDLNCKPRVYSGGGRGGAGSGFDQQFWDISSRDGADTLGDLAPETLGKDCGDASPFIARISSAEGYPYTFLHNH